MFPVGPAGSNSFIQKAEESYVSLTRTSADLNARAGNDGQCLGQSDHDGVGSVEAGQIANLAAGVFSKPHQ